MKRILFIFCLLVSAYSYAQYNPTNFTVSNKSYGPAQYVSTDARSWYYDATNFVMRDYQSTAEVNSYINVAKYRGGHFPIFIHLGGTLNGNGTYTGGITQVWFYKDGTSDGNLVRWYTDSTVITPKVDTIYRKNDSVIGFTINNGPEQTIIIRGTAAGGSINSLTLAAPSLLFGTPINFSNSLGAWSGTMTLNNQNPNTFFAGPTSGSPGAPTMRQLVVNDLPINIPNGNLLNSSITFGIGTSGTSPNWSTTSPALGSSTVLNIPLVNSLNTGLATPTQFGYWNQKIDSLTISNDTIYKWANGIRTFQGVVTGGGGGSGTVTNFIFTNGGGIAGIVTNSTTTPTLALSPSFTGLTFSNGSAFAAATVSAPLTYSAGTLGIQIANTSQSGAISNTDWNTFNTKQNPITLTTTGTTGAATFISNTLNIPQYQGQITLTTTGTSGAATLIGNTLNIPQYAGTTYTFNNGLTNTSGTVQLGGALIQNTTVGTAGFSLLITGLPSKATALGTDSVLLEDISGKVWKLPVPSGGGGSGTVTSFSAGNLSPLFTTSVATATTTPALTFALSNAAANSILGNNTGSSAAPTYFVPTATTLNGWFGGTIQGALTLTTTGSSGASTLIGNTLNIPQYSGGGGGTVLTDASLLGNGSTSLLKIDSALLNRHEGIDTLGLDTLGLFNYDTLYSSQTFPTAWYGTAGTASATSYSGNNLVLSNTTNNDYGSYLTPKIPVGGSQYVGFLPNWNHYIIVQPTLTPSATTYGIGLGRTGSIIVAWVDLSTGANAGKVFITDNGTNLATSTGTISYSQNDLLKIQSWYQNDSIYCSVSNLTTGAASVNVSYGFVYNVGNPFSDKIGSYAIFQKGGAYVLYSDRIASNVFINAPIAAVGDSKINYYQGVPDSTWPNQLNKKLTVTQSFGSSGDQTIDLQSRIQDIIMAREKQVILEIGSNDLRAAIPLATWTARYKLITDSLTKAGIRVWHICPWENQTNLAQLDSFLNATYPTRYIRGVYTQMQACGLACLVADQVHPNTRGADTIYTAIVRDGRVAINNFRQTLNFIDARKVGTNYNAAAMVLVNDMGSVKQSTLPLIGGLALTGNTFSANSTTTAQLLVNNNGAIQTSTPDLQGLLANGGNSFSTFSYGSKNGAAVQQLFNNTLAVSWEGYPTFARFFKKSGGFIGLMQMDSLGNTSFGNLTAGIPAFQNVTRFGSNAAPNVSGSRNTIIGTSAGASLSSGKDNTYLGYLNNWNSNGDSNTVAGSSAAGSGVSTPVNGLAIFGAYAGFGNLFGKYNTHVGFRAGNTSVNASHQITLGDNVITSSPNVDYEFNFGDIHKGVRPTSGTNGKDSVYGKIIGLDTLALPNIIRKLLDTTNFKPAVFDASGNVFKTDWATFGGGTPGGANTQIQFNNSGAFGASANLTWNGTTLTTNALAISTYAAAGANDSVLTWDAASKSVRMRSGIFNLYAGNGMNFTGGDTVNWGGTLALNTVISGAGFSIAFGTSGSNLGGFSITGGKYNSSQGAQILGAASTINNAITAASGNVTNFSAYAFLAPTVTSTNTGVTYSHPSTLYIDAAPTMSTNSTASNAVYALNVNSGISHFGLGASNISGIFDGSISVGVSGSVSNAYFLEIGASSSSQAQLRFDVGTDPTSPGGGSIWNNGTNLYFVDGNANNEDLLDGPRDRVTETSAATLTLSYSFNFYAFTGTTTTWTLPTRTTRPGMKIKIKNAGSGNITLNADSGTDIYDTGAVSSITIAPGTARVLTAGPSFWYVN